MNISQAQHVFVSYSHNDDKFTNSLVADLRARGFTVWIDDTGIPPGTPNWEKTLREAISKAYAVILIASPHALSSDYVGDEIALAKAYKHTIFPVWADGTEWVDCVPIGYFNMQYIDARETRYKSALDKLVSRLGTLSPPSQVAGAYSNSYLLPTLSEQLPIITSRRPTPRIFVSHSSKDNEFCFRLVDGLRRALGDEEAVWYDTSGGLHGGDSWWSKSEQELKTRSVFIVVLSPDAMNSNWVDNEIEIALRQKNSPRRILIIPVLYRPCEISPSLKSLQYISFLQKPYEAAFQELLVALGV
jgi:hypothetical protein